MAIATLCQTNGVEFHTTITLAAVMVQVELPFDLSLTEDQAVILEANIHNAMELVLAQYFVD